MHRLEIHQSLWALELRRPDGFEWPLEKKFEMCRTAGYPSRRPSASDF